VASCLIEIQARGSYGFQSKKPLWRVQKHFGFQSKKHFGGGFGLYDYIFFQEVQARNFSLFCEAHPETKMCVHSWGGGIIVCYNVPYNYTTTNNYEFF
jgi:hypothetical protein